MDFHYRNHNNLRLIKMKKIKLYWWKDAPNFGDAASPYIIQKLFGLNIVYCNPSLCIHKEIYRLIRNMCTGKQYVFPSSKGYVYPWEKGLYAIGSILDGSTYKTLVWGSGFREFNSKYKGGKIYAVRGKLTQNLLPDRIKNKVLAIGDPVLLLPLVYTPDRNVSHNIGIVPHFMDYDYFSSTYGQKYFIIDVRTSDVEKVIQQICSCKLILSTSLHGLIISHAYGIPALWIRKGWINSSEFKFYDYFSSVNIPKYDGFFNLDEILLDNGSIENLFIHNKELSLIHSNLQTIQEKLIKAFPFSEDTKANTFHV